MFGRAACDAGPNTWRPWLATPRFQSSAILRECGELPQRGLARLIFRISLRTSGDTHGRPSRWRLFQFQYSRKPLRCQTRTVSGLTRSSAERQSFHDNDLCDFIHWFGTRRSKVQILSPRPFFCNQQLTRIRIVNERLVRDQAVNSSNPLARLLLSPLKSMYYAAFLTATCSSFLRTIRTTSAILGGRAKPKPTVSACCKRNATS